MPEEWDYYVGKARELAAKAAAEADPVRRLTLLQIAFAYYALAEIRDRWHDQPDRVLGKSQNPARD